MTRRFSWYRPLLLLLALSLSAGPALADEDEEADQPRPRPAAPPPAAPCAGDLSTMAKRLKTLEETHERLAAELDVTTVQWKMMVERSGISFRNRFFVKGGFSLITARRSTFNFNVTGYGIGLLAGLGRYIGRSNVIELELSSDAMLAVALRYRFELQLESPKISIGPVIGIRQRLGRTFVDDQYLEKPTELKDWYATIGGVLGVPVGRAMAMVDVCYVTNSQSFLFANAVLAFIL